MNNGGRLAALQSLFVSGLSIRQVFSRWPPAALEVSTVHFRIITVSLVVLIHVLALWALAMSWPTLTVPKPVGEIHVAMLGSPQPAKPVMSVPIPQLPSIAFVPAPEIQIAGAQPGATLGLAIVVPPRPDTSHPNQNPALPAAFANIGKQVQVALAVLVDVDGHIREAKIARTSGEPALDQLAESFTMANWRFRPAQQNGVAVLGWTTMLVTFEQAG